MFLAYVIVVVLVCFSFVAVGRVFFLLASSSRELFGDGVLLW